MTASRKYEHDVFISYDSDERVWALELEHDLKQRGVPDVFLDQKRLVPGTLWEPQLAASVPLSQHFVVLWSKAAELSDWVREETIRFKSVIDPKGTGPLPTDRRLFQILMQPDQSPTLRRYHAFTSLQKVNLSAGPPGMSAVERSSWDAIIGDIAEAVIPPVPGTPWPVAVMATTASVLAANAPAPPPNFQGTFPQFLSDIGIPSYAQFVSQYDARPEKWKPFGSSVPITDILDALLTTVNGRLAAIKPGEQMRWQYVDLITTPFVRLDDEVRKLSSGPALLIIDPLSILIQPIGFRYLRLEPCFKNRSATILWLTPFPPHQPSVILREAVKNYAIPLLSGYYDPLPPGTPYGRCAVNLGDDFELTRLVLSAVAEMPVLAAAGATSAVLSVGPK